MIENLLNLLFSHSKIEWPGFFTVEGPTYQVVSEALILATLAAGSFVWIYLDAEKRGKSRIIAILFILLTGWPLSFIWWFWLRPPVQTHRLLKPA